MNNEALTINELYNLNETIAAKIVKVIDTVEPEEELAAKYEEKYQQFRKIYPTVKSLF